MLAKDFLITPDYSIKATLKKLDETGLRTLFVVTETNELLGSVTDGDIRRYILRGESLDGDIKKVYNSNPYAVNQNNYDLAVIEKLFNIEMIELLPVIDNNKIVKEVITWPEIFSKAKDQTILTPLDIPVIIMAGGKGSRMDPFTRILPKPLIPIGDKTIAEVIIDEFRKYGVTNYYMTLNYKGEMIEAYFNSIEKDFKISYCREKEFYGTAGSLKLLEGFIADTFIVSNCDIVVKADYHDAVNFHYSNNADFTIISSIQNHKIPYGVISFIEGGEVTQILEKPEYTFTINTGVYILNKECLKYIPENTVFDMPTLIDMLLKEKKKVLTYPVNENDYIDIGQWEEYKKATEKLKIMI